MSIQPTLTPDRPAWRDAIKDDARLTSNEVLVALLIADYWREGEPIWAAVDILIMQSRLSRAAVFRALKKLRDLDYLVEVERARHGRSPRWRPIIPNGHQSHRETVQSQSETNQSPSDTRHHTNSPQTPDLGSGDLDCESRPAFAGAKTRPDLEYPDDLTAAQRRDYHLLADHMLGYEAHVKTVWMWMTTGSRPRDKNLRTQTPMGRPGAFAADRHAKPTSESGVSEWQGYFRSHFAAEGAGLPASCFDSNDPRAA